MTESARRKGRENKGQRNKEASFNDHFYELNFIVQNSTLNLQEDLISRFTTNKDENIYK